MTTEYRRVEYALEINDTLRGLREVSPAEVFERAKKEARIRAPASAERKLAPPPWFARYVSGGVDVGMLSVGEGRVLCAAGALRAACAALGILEEDRPRLRFLEPHNVADGTHYLAEFRWSPGGGLAVISTGLSLVKTIEAAAHEVTHARQTLDYGQDIRYAPARQRADWERQARYAGEDFTDFLQRRFDIYDCKLDEPRAVSWAKWELEGRNNATWTPPAWAVTT